MIHLSFNLIINQYSNLMLSKITIFIHIIKLVNIKIEFLLINC